MKTVSNPPLLSLGSAACHIRSSPPTCAAPGLGGPNVVPPSLDLPTVMLAAVRLEYARPESLGFPKPSSAAVSCGPIAQSQSPPPAVWSGKPRKVDADPSCVTRKALQPAGTPVGPMTKDRPNRSVRMLGSAALLLPASSRFVLNVAAEGSAVRRRAPPIGEVAAATGPAPRDVLSETLKRTTMTDERARAP